PPLHLHIMYILIHGSHLVTYTHFYEINKASDLVTLNGAKVMQLEAQYGIEAGKPANFIVLDAGDAYEAIRERADVLSSVRNGEYLFKRAPRTNEIAHDFLK